MHSQLVKTFRWLRLVWTDAKDDSSQTWRRHVRGLMIGWALTALAMSLVQLYPNEANLSMRLTAANRNNNNNRTANQRVDDRA